MTKLQRYVEQYGVIGSLRGKGAKEAEYVKKCVVCGENVVLTEAELPIKDRHADAWICAGVRERNAKLAARGVA